MNMHECNESRKDKIILFIAQKSVRFLYSLFKSRIPTLNCIHDVSFNIYVFMMYYEQLVKKLNSAWNKDKHMRHTRHMVLTAELIFWLPTITEVFIHLLNVPRR